MNTSCKANTEQSCCITNLFNPNLSNNHRGNFTKGFLPFLSKNCKKETRVRDLLTYKDAGVDIDAGSELVRRIAKMAPEIGGFGGLFPLGIIVRDSYLVAGTDGVGTKLKLAFETGIHETILAVNEPVTSEVKPLFFLDYFATSRLDVDLAEKVIKGIVDGCQQSDCTLLGGETAEMLDFYADGEYDLSGFAVGIVKKDSVIDGRNIAVGDVLIGLPSGGVPMDFLLVLEWSCLSLKDKLPGSSVTLGEALMAPTVIYVKQVLDIISAGRIEDAEMRRTFNMGIGLVLVVNKESALRILGEGHGKVIMAVKRTTEFFYAYYALKTITAMVTEGGVICLSLSYLVN
ncbi:hypothetical protein Pfo_023521 [Paulownia fortunei]|nr:hypothetical protein Pfo_023521 [Paulownia fortunei]